MSDAEDFDELPSITVNSSIHESSSFKMPSAEELASQRAREEECERALLRLREEHPADTESCSAMVAALAHSDSSGSEGEAALAAAVGALRVRTPRAAPAPRPATLLAALQPLLPEDHFLAAYAAAVQGASDAVVQALTDEMCSHVSDMVVRAADVQVWRSEEVVGVAAWVCAAAEVAAPPARRRLLRTLHLLVDDVATDEQVESVGALLVAAATEAACALELSDALRSGDTRGEAISRRLASAALARLASLPEPPESLSELAGGLAGAWRRLPPARQYLALQLLARLLPPPAEGEGQGEGGEEDAARRLLDTLAQAAPGQRAQTTETLKVLVAATKLQVLFHVKK